MKKNQEKFYEKKFKKNISKKIIAVVLVLMSIFVCASCATASESATPQPSSQAEPAKEQSKSMLQAPSINLDLLKEPWAEVDEVSANYVFAYQDLDKLSRVLMSYVKHYEDREQSLADDLKLNVQNYTEQTLLSSMKEVDVGEVEYFDIEGYPAARFEITGKATDESEEFLAKTIFIANDKGIYCLQMQSRIEDEEEFAPLFKQLSESLAMSDK